MWYVNGILYGLFFGGSICFILTMWYVNVNKIFWTKIKTTKFYINYVNQGEQGLKGDAFTCFILTMWYVNYFPNDSSLVKSYRNKIIRKEFYGDYKVISRKFRISEVKVRNIINLKDL